MILADVRLAIFIIRGILIYFRAMVKAVAAVDHRSTDIPAKK